LAGDPVKVMEFTEFTAKPPFQKLDESARLESKAWETLIEDVFRVYQETALKEVGPEPIIAPGKMRKPEIWR